MSLPVPPLLKELHRLRRHLRNLQDEIDQGPRILAIREQQLANEEQHHKNAYELIQRSKLQQKDDEVTLKQTELQLAKFQSDLNMAGSKKEFDAKQHEIEMAIARKESLEDRILTIITEIEDRIADLPNVEKRWADAQAEFKQFQREAEERFERMKSDQEESRKRLFETEEKLPPEVRLQYDRLIKRFGPDALAGVSGRTCLQCRMSITEQQRNNLLGGGFVCCPQCARGLYLAD